MQLFSFPIIVGQERYETIMASNLPASAGVKIGKSSPAFRSVVLRRRALGLSPVVAEADDQIPSPESGSARVNRIATAADADADGFLWTHTIKFYASHLRQRVTRLTNADGLPVPPKEWGEGTAQVTCFPAFAEPGADGLLIRVEISNNSSETQNYFVDLFEGIDTITRQFQPQDLGFDVRQDCVVMRHVSNDQSYAIAMIAPTQVKSSRTTEAVFKPEAALTLLDPITNLDAPADTEPGAWGRVHAGKIVIGPREKRVVWLCVGIGKDNDSAAASERTLLRLAEDTTGRTAAHPGVYSLALNSHEKAKYGSGDDMMDRLMAQSLLDVPDNAARRLGAATRTADGGGSYYPQIGGYEALGWIYYRPDWAATQLNAWFATLSNPDLPLRSFHAMPSPDLFVAWKLYHATGSDTFIKYLYPFAKHRYEELRDGCRTAAGSWLFAWPAIRPDGVTTTAADPIADPACSAKVAISAQLLHTMSLILDRPLTEVQGYEDDAKQAIAALNDQLWQPQRGLYAPRLVSSTRSGASPAFSESDTIDCLLPLMCGSKLATPDRIASLLKRLEDPTDFWADGGIRSESKRSATYSPSDRAHGGVLFGTNWLLWQALFDLGEFDVARKLADNLLKGYRYAARELSAFPAWLDGNTGQACGPIDWSGDACALIWLYSAYHSKGIVTCSQTVALLDHRYDNATDSVRVVFKPDTASVQAIQCVMSGHGQKYVISGDITGNLTSDENGVLLVKLTGKAGTQQFTVSPANSQTTGSVSSR